MVGILGANSVSGFNITNSVRFNPGDTPIIKKTPDASNRRTWTFSTWTKRSSVSGNQRMLAHSDGQDDMRLRFTPNLHILDTAATGSSAALNLTTNAVFRDTAAWYHIVAVFDTTQGTASNRVKLYVNGTLQTSFSTANYPDQNAQGLINSNVEHTLGGRIYDGTTDQNIDGYLADTYFIDGTAKAATDFGEVDDNGVWVPIKYDGSYGTEGYHLEYKQTGTSADASGIGADTSGNGNHYAVANLAATDITTDTPTNNFATLNPLVPTAALFSEGNCFVTGGGADTEDRVYSTIAVSTGKWYWELKKIDNSFQVGIAPQPTDANTNGVNKMGYGANEISYYDGNGYKYINNSGSSYGDAIADGDIVGVALDLDNNKLYFSRNGTFQNSGDPTSGATGTGAISVVAVESNGTGGYVAAGSHNAGGSYNGTAAYNFGNPSFAISSGNADGRGYGNFEYAVPSGYYSLCTKNLGEFG